MAKIKPETPVRPVQVTGNLLIIILVISCTRRVLDFGHVGVFGDVGRPLHGGTGVTDRGNDVLQEFELRDPKVFGTSAGGQDSILMCVKGSQRSVELSQCPFIENRHLAEVTKV